MDAPRRDGAGALHDRVCEPASAQAPGESRTPTLEPNAAAANPAGAADTGPLAPLAWLEGCWQGTVNQREFREHWLPLRGGMLIGAGQSVLRGKHAGLRVPAHRAEERRRLLHSVLAAIASESSFKLAETTTEDKDTIFTFANTADAFPARLIYRRGTEGWLYADDRRQR